MTSLFDVDVEVFKFGGTSLGSADRIEKAARLCTEMRDPKCALLVVASAMGGVTAVLRATLADAAAGTVSLSEIDARLEALRERHVEAGWAPDGDGDGAGELAAARDLLHGVRLVREATPRVRDSVLGLGERLAAPLLARAVGGRWLDARKVLRTDATFGAAAPDLDVTRELLATELRGISAGDVVVLSGFVGSTSDGVETTLGRSGSDYTATIVGACVGAPRVVIWTDVCGVLSADPRVVPDAFTLASLTYEEASELAFFGASVLHPRTMLPMWRQRIPIEIRNTLAESPTTAPFTKIHTTPSDTKAVSSVENVSIVMLEGAAMRNEVGIAGRALQSLQRCGVSVKMISQSSSESAICLVLDASDAALATAGLNAEFALERKAGIVSAVSTIDDLAIVALVGEGMRHTLGVAGAFFDALARSRVNVVAISQAASETNISCVVANTDIVVAMQAIHEVERF